MFNTLKKKISSIKIFQNNKTKKNKNILGIGKHGIVYKLEDYILLEEEIDKIEIFGLNKNKIINNKSDILNYIKFLHNSKNKIVKIVKSNDIFNKEKIIKKDFIDEIKLNRKIIDIYGKYANEYLTVQPIGKFMDILVIGSKVILKNNKYIYLIFGSKCNNKFNINMKKYINDILESLIILQKKGYQHDDLKLDNTVLCSDKYKIIDWGKLRKIDRVSLRTIFGLNHSPIFLYIYKTHGFTSKYIEGIPPYESFIVEQLLIKYLDKNLLWMKEMLNFPLFKSTISRVSYEFKEIISNNPNRKELLQKYKYTADIYMFGIALIYIVYKYKLDINKYKPIINKFTSLLDPPKNAIEALKYANSIL